MFYSCTKMTAVGDNYSGWTDTTESYFEASGSEEDSADPSPWALALVDEVELGDELVHCVTGLRDGAKICDEVDVVTLLHTATVNGW